MTPVSVEPEGDGLVPGSAGPLGAGGVTLWVRRLPAAPTAPPGVLALHGGPGLDHHTLLPLGRALSAKLGAGCPVWLPDLPGHGRSLPPSGRLPGLAALEEGLAGWLAALPAASWVLVGHSLGAWLVQELLRRRRVRPRAAVLLAPPAAGQSGSTSALSRAARLRGGRPVGRAFPAGRDAAGSARRAREELLAHAAAECAGGPAEEFLRAIGPALLRSPGDYGALLKDLHRALAGPVRPFDPGCPVLVLCGERDRTTPLEQARRVAASLAGARLEALAGLGHYPFAERAGEVAAHICRFLGEVGA